MFDELRIKIDRVMSLMPENFGESSSRQESSEVTAKGSYFRQLSSSSDRDSVNDKLYIASPSPRPPTPHVDLEEIPSCSEQSVSPAPSESPPQSQIAISLPKIKNIARVPAPPPIEKKRKRKYRHKHKHKDKDRQSSIRRFKKEIRRKSRILIMTEDERRNEIIAQIEQIKLGCTVWVPRLTPEEINQYTQREKPIKLNKIGERHYEIDDSSDNEPMTISLSDTESDDPPSIPSAAAHEKVAENIPLDDAVTVECDSRENTTEKVDSNIPIESPATPVNAPPANFYLEGVPTDESQNAVETISEASTVISVSPAATETQSNVSPVNVTVSTDKSQNSVIVTVSEASPVIPVPSVAATAADAPVTAEDALARAVNVPAAAPHSPANNEEGVIRRNITFKKTPTPAVNSTKPRVIEITKDGVIRPLSNSAVNEIPPDLMKLTAKTGLSVNAIRQKGNHGSSLTIADAVNKTLESIMFPKSANNQQDNLSMPSLDDNNVIANDPITSTSRSSTTLPSLPAKDDVPAASRSPSTLVSSLTKEKDAVSITHRSPPALPSLPAKDAVPVTSRSPTTMQSLLARDDISITPRPPIASPSLPAKDAIPISSELSTSLPSLTTKNALSTSSQLPISSASVSKDALPISSRLSVISSSLPTTDVAPITKIRVKSTQDLGVKDPRSGTNFLNTKTETSSGGDGYPSKQSVNSNFGPTMKNTNINKPYRALMNITLDEYNNYITSIALTFKLQCSTKKQYESKRNQLIKRYSSASSVQNCNDMDIELQVLRSQHEASIRDMNEQILSKLNECVGFKQFDGIIYEIFLKFLQQTKKTWPQMKKFESVETLSQMWKVAISSDVYSVSNLAKVIPRDRFISTVEEIFLSIDKTTHGRKRAFPTQSQVPSQQSSQELPVKVPRQSTTAMPPVHESKTENRNLMRPLQPPIGGPGIENGNSMWPPVNDSSPRVSSLSQMAKNAIPAFPLASDSMSELIKRFFTEPSPNSSSHAVQNRLNDSQNVVNVDHAYSNVINEMLNDVPARDKIAMTANQPKSNPTMNARSQCHLYEKSPPTYSIPVIMNENRYARGETIRQTFGGAVNRAPCSGHPTMYQHTSSNVAPFQPTTVHSSTRLSSPNYSSISPRQTPPAFSPCSSRCNSPTTCRQISCHSPFNYPPSISLPYLNYPPHQSPYRYPSPGSLPPNVNLFHQNSTWNDQQIRGRNFNESVRNYMPMPYMNNSVIRQNANSTAVTAISMEHTMRQYVSPVQRDHAYVAFPENPESSQTSTFRPQPIGLPPFSSFVSNENLVVRVADSSLSPSAGPSPNPTSNDEMPLSVPIVQSTSSPSVDQLYELEGLESIGQPLKDSEIQELLLSDFKKSKNEF